MSVKYDYASDLKFATSILEIANKYDSDYLRRVANRLNYIIEERKRDGKYVCLETVGRSTSSRIW